MKKLYEQIGKLEMIIVKYAIALLTLLVFGSAIARTLHFPIVWAVDAATFIFAWCVFLGADMAMRKDRLVTIDLLTDRLPKKVVFYIRLFNHVLIIIFLLALIVYGFWLSYTTRLRTFQGIPGFSYTWVTISVPIGCILMLSTTIVKIKEQITAGYQFVRKSASSHEI